MGRRWIPLAQRSTISRFYSCISKRNRIVASYQWKQGYRFLSSDPFAFYRKPSEGLWKVLQAENERTLASIDLKLCDILKEEIRETYESVPDPVPELGPTGIYLYFSKDLEDGTRIFRRRHVKTCEEQTILEIPFQQFQIQAMSLSVDESMMAYLISSVDNPSYPTIKIRHLQSQQDLEVPTIKDKTIGTIEWGPFQDNGDHSLFFTTQNHLHRPDTVYVVRLSDNLQLSKATMIYSNDDEAVMVDIQRTKGCQYVAISARTKTSNEIYLVGNLRDNLILVRGRQKGIQYSLDVGQNNDIWIAANASFPDHCSGLGEEIAVFETSIDALPLLDSFGTLCAESDEFIINDIDLFRQHIVYYQRSSTTGHQRLRIDNRFTGVSNIVDHLGESSSILLPGGNICFDATSLRVGVESPFSKGSVYELDLSSGVTTKVSACNDGKHQKYLQQRFLVTSYDGTNVPLTLIHHHSIDPFAPTESPVVLHGYGAYGEPVMGGFDPVAVPLLDRGFVIAYAHTRGGGELGRAWYRSGRSYEKKNAIEDFLACAKYLVANVTTPSLLTVMAFSAGGVVVGAAINTCPELFGGVVLRNAFLDVSSSTANSQQPLTEHEYEEWGNPEVDAEAASFIASYCPFSNLQPTSVYPRALIVGTLDDTNVPFWHAVTYQRKYQKKRSPSGRSSALLFIVPRGGHHLHGARLEVSALEAAFIVENSHVQ